MQYWIALFTTLRLSISATRICGNSTHHIRWVSKRYLIADLRYTCHGQVVPLVRISGLATAEYSITDRDCRKDESHSAKCFEAY